MPNQSRPRFSKRARVSLTVTASWLTTWFSFASLLMGLRRSVGVATEAARRRLRKSRTTITVPTAHLLSVGDRVMVPPGFGEALCGLPPQSFVISRVIDEATIELRRISLWERLWGRLLQFLHRLVWIRNGRR